MPLPTLFLVHRESFPPPRRWRSARGRQTRFPLSDWKCKTEQKDGVHRRPSKTTLPRRSTRLVFSRTGRRPRGTQSRKRRLARLPLPDSRGKMDPHAKSTKAARNREPDTSWLAALRERWGEYIRGLRRGLARN